ncbi:MAG: THUMP domain-containing protein [Candidatus Thermoplasmatota archaeon]|nr:THUMP domain-containing protein [Candidatus Thermoplasmatota archaeon]
MAVADETRLIIVRYSEVGLKGNRARSMMINKLRSNILDGLDRIGERTDFTTERGRIFLSGYSTQENVFDVLSRTMGVKSFSPVVSIVYDHTEELAEKAVELYSHILPGKKFAVRSRRAGGQNFTTKELNVIVGDALYKYSSGVNLDEPEVEVNIEVRNNRAYFYTDVRKGPGGLPLGSEAPMVALMSGGIDSPVAAWMIMKRGSPVDFVFMSLSHPIDTVEFLRAAYVLIKDWALGYNPTVHIIDGKPLVELLVLSHKIKIPGVTYKRILYSLALAISAERGAYGIITGESLGQVSSQTPQNLLAINHGIDIPVYRPLIGMDKDEISDMGRNIGTFPLTSKGEFCALFSQTVVLNASADDIDRDMESYDIQEKLLKNRIILKGNEVGEYLRNLSDEDFEITKLPDNSIVVDLRSKLSYNEWHYGDAINSGLGGVRNIIEENGRDKIYVFYCQKGLQSAYAASEARNLGARSYYTSSEKIRKMK